MKSPRRCFVSKPLQSGCNMHTTLPPSARNTNCPFVLMVASKLESTCNALQGRGKACRAQIEKLVDLPGIREVLALPLLSSVLAGILPQLVLRLFFSLMPYILGFLERLEGLPAESEVEFGVVRKYFAFQVRPSESTVAAPSHRGLVRLSRLHPSQGS